MENRNCLNTAFKRLEKKDLLQKIGAVLLAMVFPLFSTYSNAVVKGKLHCKDTLLVAPSNFVDHSAGQILI